MIFLIAIYWNTAAPRPGVGLRPLKYGSSWLYSLAFEAVDVQRK